MMKRLLTKMAIFGSGAMMFAGVAMANGSTVGMGDVFNSGTGYNSLNVAKLDVDNDTSVYNDNDYRVTNDIDAYLKTGYNTIEGNNHFGGGGWFWDGHGWKNHHDSNFDSEGSINTGDARATISVTNKGNNNVTDVRSGANYALPSVGNSMTGALSENRASAYIDNEVKVVNKNDAYVRNDIDVTASTGGNTVKFNTGSASITTGDASVNISVENNLNSNTTTIR